MISRFSPFFALLIVLLACTYSSAHKVRVFAAIENGTVVGEGSLGGGRMVQNGDISIVRKSDEQLLASRQTDASGRFDISLQELGIKEPTDLIVILDAGPGHRATWQIKADDYLMKPAEQSGAAAVSPAAHPPSESLMPSSPPLKNIITGVIIIIGLGFLIAWARKRGGGS